MSRAPATRDLLAEDAARGIEVRHRLTAIRELLAARGATAALLKTRRNFAWATAGGANHVVLASQDGAVPLLVTPSEAVAIAPINEAARIADEEVAGLPVEVASVPWEDPDAIEERARQRTQGTPLSDDDLEADLMPLRAVLSAFDQGRMTSLGEQTIRAMRAAFEEAGPGVSEQEVAARAIASLAQQGVRAPVVLAAADERISRYRHPLPTATVAKRRLMLVLVAERWGLHVALTRILDFEPPEAELRRRSQAVSQILEEMRSASRPGQTLGEVLATAVSAYERAGFHDEWRLHHQGGLIGYQGRERIATPGDLTRIEAGMAFAWNPSITGAKVEETFILQADGSARVIAPV
ncbi:MAG: M24 family metallopeptidase [Chloroflexi bacterium]|nr:M24 family metallopeptidase [Chloroflexota bacterium]